MTKTLVEDLYSWLQQRRMWHLSDPVALAMSSETLRFIAWQFCERGNHPSLIDIYYWITKGDYGIWGIPVKIDESVGFGRYVFIHEKTYMGAT